MFRKTIEPAAHLSHSAYERALGAEFAELHPQLQRYLGAIPVGGVGVGVGVFHDAGLRIRTLRPLFALLGGLGIAFPERGEDVPFRVHNRPEADGSVSAVRTFSFASGEREMRDRIGVTPRGLVDRLGRGGLLEVELAAGVRAGILRLESRRLALRIRGIRLPLPRIVRVTLQEEALPGSDGAQRVTVDVRAPLLGQVYGYAGTFRYRVEMPAEASPPHCR